MLIDWEIKPNIVLTEGKVMYNGYALHSANHSPIACIIHMQRLIHKKGRVQ